MVEDPQTKKMVPAERFCGSYFPEVKSKFPTFKIFLIGVSHIQIWKLIFYPFTASAQPYALHIVTDENEDGDQGNLGFEINFRQNLCYS